MASLVAGGVKSLAENFAGNEGRTEQVVAAWNVLGTVSAYQKLETPVLTESDPPACYLLDHMPLRSADHIVSARHLVDWVEVEGHCDIRTVEFVENMAHGSATTFLTEFSRGERGGGWEGEGEKQGTVSILFQAADYWASATL